MACVACNIKHITDEFFLIAAEVRYIKSTFLLANDIKYSIIIHLKKSLSEHVSKQELDEGRVYPNLNRIQAVSLQIAVDVSKYALSKNLCHLYPIPESIEEHIKKQVYQTAYKDSLKAVW